MMNFDHCPGLARALFEENRNAQFLLDSAAEHIVDANGAAQRLTGFAIRELLRRPVQSLLRLPGRCEAWRAQMPTGPSLQPIRMRCRFRTFGSARWLPVHIRLVWLPVQPNPLILMSVRPVQRRIPRVAQLRPTSSQALIPASDTLAG